MMSYYEEYSTMVYAIIGAAMKVHTELSWGLLEPIYNEALSLELTERGISNEIHKHLPCYYKGKLLSKHYEMDLVVDDIVVELKSTKELIPAHRAQLFNYMRLTRSHVGILINFGQPSLQGERYGWDPESNECHLLDKNMKIIPMVDECWDDDTPVEYVRK